MAKRGLGKGLDVLIGSAAAAEGNRLEDIPVKDIRPNPRQPRKKFDRDALDEMTRSIETFGVVQPIIVRTVGTDYELIAGERRWRAAQEAGLDRIPAVIRQSTETDSLEMALIENLHRSDLNGLEEAAAYQQLLEDFAITHEELSRRVGKSRATITNTLRLLQLPARIQREVMDQRISTGHARALLAFQDDPSRQDTICSRIIAEGLSVRQVEEMARPAEAAEESPAPESRTRPVPPEEALEMFSRLQEVLETRVRGSVGKRKGRLIIEFRNMGDLRRIVDSIVSRATESAQSAEIDAELEPED
ncbi:MAG: ParB/RepB/Spo0J family partition protein [Candidatus Geothermincolia bacterium]